MAALWITADEAQARLGIRLQTLSAYVDRGLVTARTDETDPRRSLYAAEDVTRLIQRRNRVAAKWPSAPSIMAILY
jgi:citrate synthase